MKLLAWGTGFGCTLALAHTPNGPATVFLIVVLAACFVALTVPSRRPNGYVAEARKWDELNPTAHLSTLDRLDGVGNRKASE